MDLKSLKKKSVDISTLVAAASEMEGNKSNGPDERMWKPSRDKAGNGYAVIRFLPAPDNEIGWTRYWDHGFQGPTGKWYIEKSLTTLGQDDPVGKINSAAWAAGDQQSARDRKRRLHYVANILVLSDPANPENEGKVFLYEFGKKIFDKLKEAMQPEFPDETPINPFDMWNGADFVIKVRKVEGWVNYDKSEFKSPSELYDGDEAKLEKVVSQLYPLAEFTDPSTFKSYADLEKRLNEVLGTGERSAPVAPVAPPAMEQAKTVAPEPVAETAESEVEAEEATVDDEDETLAYFKKIAENA
jgi:ribosomal protein L12E/L44/L45/RPP1/RPP2